MFISNKEFKVQVPVVHPKSFDYEMFWDEQLTRVEAGMWFSGKWMPGRLYYYSNFHHIFMNKGKLRQKVFSLPDLRDLEWEWFLLLEEARGFSGFDGDEYYTCHRRAAILNDLTDEEKLALREEHPEIWSDERLAYKEYIPARAYLRQIHHKNLGIPIYNNDAQNFLLMSGRGVGKSYYLSAVILHEWLFDGRPPIHKYMSQEERLRLSDTRTSIIIGAGDLKKSSETMKKVSEAFTRLPGEYSTGDKKFAAPFSKQYTGNWETEIVSKYKKKVGGVWEKEAGTKSKIRNLSYADNPYNGQGDRNNLILFEEIGHFKNAILAYQAVEHNMKFSGIKKFGTLMMVGCVMAGTKVWTKDGRSINIEDLKQEDGLIGYDGENAIPQEINWFKEPAKKESYRITTEGGRSLECSYDHPLIVGKRAEKTNIYSENKERLFKVQFKEVKDIQIGDYLFSLDDLNIFGNKEIKDARLIGLMIGDGYYGSKKTSNSLSTDSKGVQDFIENNYSTSIRKRFLIKNGSESYIDYVVKDINKILNEAGINGQKRFEKRLPNNIHEYSKKSLAELLGGYFDADGNVYYNKKKDSLRIVLTSIVLPLLEQVREQLTKFGIHASILKEKRNQEPTKSYEGQQDHIYRLYIVKKQDVEKFKDNIKLLSNHKQQVLDTFTKSGRDFGRPEKVAFIYNNENKKGEYFKDNPIFKNTKFEKVKSIEYLGEQTVYNLNVSPTHTYITNGFISANTGGAMSHGGTIDSQFMFYNPEAFDLLTFYDEWEMRGKIAYFVPSYLGLNHLRDSEGIIDVEKAKKELNAHLEKLKKTKDRSSYEMEITYSAQVPSEVFMMPDGNIFPIMELRERLSELEKNNELEILEKRVQLYYDQKGLNGVNYNLLEKSQATAINQYPWPDGHDKEGVPVIYEFPIEEEYRDDDGVSRVKVPDGLYVIGHDPFRTNAENGSLASIVVMKTKKYAHKYGHDQIVAAYYGRPFEGRDAVNEILLKLSLFYNAKVMFENNVGNVKDYFEKKKRLDLLYRRPTTVLSNKDVQTINPSSLDYGYPLSNQKFKLEALQYIRTWLLEERGRESVKKQIVTYDKYGRKRIIETTESQVSDKDENQKSIRNLDRLQDRRLLQELISYNLDGNFDAVHGLAGCVLAMEEDFNKKTIEMFANTANEELKFLTSNKKIFKHQQTNMSNLFKTLKY